MTRHYWQQAYKYCLSTLQQSCTHNMNRQVLIFFLHPLQKQERTGFNFFHLIGGRRKQGVLKISVSYTCANLEDIQASVIA